MTDLSWLTWVFLIVVVGVGGWFAWRWLSALAFRHLMLNSVARKYGWQVELPAVDGWAQFREQEQRRQRKAWGLLRHGMSGLREGYRTGVFGRDHVGSWHSELSLTGAWRGHQFAATQIRRFESRQSGERTERQVRRRASVSLVGAFPALFVRVRWFGRVEGHAPPEVIALAKASRWRFRELRADGGGMHAELGSRLRRGQLVATLNLLTAVAERCPPPR